MDSEPVSEHPLIERIARYLAGRPAATGDWPIYLDDAASLLALMQEPDAAMAQAGDVCAWIGMIDAALRERWTLPEALQASAAGDASPHHGEDGHDEEGEAPVAPENLSHDNAAWAAINEREKSA